MVYLTSGIDGKGSKRWEKAGKGAKRWESTATLSKNMGFRVMLQARVLFNRKFPYLGGIVVFDVL